MWINRRKHGWIDGWGEGGHMMGRQMTDDT